MFFEKWESPGACIDLAQIVKWVVGIHPAKMRSTVGQITAKERNLDTHVHRSRLRLVS